MASPAPVAAEELRVAGIDHSLPASTAEVEPLAELVGQSRAHEAIDFGLRLEHEGFNIVVTGVPGSGRNTLARQIVDTHVAGQPPPRDWCYVFNFADTYRPRAIPLPPGTGDDLERSLNELVEVCRTDIPKAFESESYQQQAAETMDPIGKQRERSLEELSQEAGRLGFIVNATPMGFIPVPVGRDGKPLPPETINNLPAETRQILDERAGALQERIAETIRQFRKLEREARTAMEALDKEVTRFVVGDRLDELRENEAYAELRGHFDAIEQDIIEHAEQFKRFSDTHLEQLPAHVVAQMMEERELLLRRYTVNLFVTHGEEPHDGAPVVAEPNPTYYNLFGRIDYTPRMGALSTDFTHVRPGAFHAANGGVLILQLEDLLSDPRAWLKLKRCLKTHEIEIENLGEGMTPFPTTSMTPESIPLEVQVVLVGRPFTVVLLDALDPEFRELFKIRAEFEPDMDLTDDAVGVLARFVRRVVDECELPHFDREALAEVVQYSARLTGRRDRLTSRFGFIADLCGQAGEVARTAGKDVCERSDVLAAVDLQRRRSGLIPDRIRRMIAEGMLHVETAGQVVGQVNGLAVYQIGTESFGTPARITCRVGLGRRGVVAIEREVERSGAIHTKGVLVLTGYISGSFGRDRPLVFNASITFEQSYDEVEGDSASSAELYAILTSLAKIPIRQDVAVTGSVDQFGRIQPVGGVTEKVEGFFDVCREVGLSGTQGVILPKSNLVNLTLRPDVIEEVRAGRFHLWPVERVEEGLELLTGTEAGVLDEDGIYPEGTIFRGVTDALDQMWEMARVRSDSDGANGGA